MAALVAAAVTSKAVLNRRVMYRAYEIFQSVFCPQTVRPRIQCARPQLQRLPSPLRTLPRQKPIL